MKLLQEKPIERRIQCIAPLVRYSSCFVQVDSDCCISIVDDAKGKVLISRQLRGDFPNLDITMITKIIVSRDYLFMIAKVG